MIVITRSVPSLRGCRTWTWVGNFYSSLFGAFVFVNSYDLPIDAATPDELWGALNDEERAAFTTLLRDPTSEAAKGVLALYDSQSQSWRPWWELEHGEEKDSSYQKMVASWESFDIALSALSAPFGKHANSCRLVYNIVAIM